MRIIRKFTLLLALITTSPLLFAQGHSIGVGYSYLGNGDVNFDTAIISYGYKVNENIGFDLGLQGYNTEGDFGAELRYAATPRVKGGITTGGGHFFYVSGGWIFVDFSRPDDSDNAVTAGLGADFKVADSWGIEISYQRAFFDYTDVDVYTGTIRYQF